MQHFPTYFDAIATFILFILMFLSFKQKYEKSCYISLSFLYLFVGAINIFVLNRYNAGTFDVLISGIWMLNYRNTVKRDEYRGIAESHALYLRQKNLRTFDDIIVEAVLSCDKTGKFGYVYGIYTIKTGKLIELWKVPVKIMYDTYEEALEQGIRIAREVMNTSYEEISNEKNRITQGT